MSRSSKRQYREVPEGSHGLLLIDKPSGPTSHDIVAKLRWHLGIKKVGHGGTLDPLATGLLIILVGRGTKLSNWIMGSDKIYQGTMRLGVRTDTQDAQGDVLEERDPSRVTREMVQAEMTARIGDQMQTPPMVSAIKKNGVPLYKMARKGLEVEREPRLIHIYSFQLLSYDSPLADFSLCCTKGTYVRTLCDDIGEALQCGAHLGALRRTESGEYSVDQAISLEEALACTPDQLFERVIPISRVEKPAGAG